MEHFKEDGIGIVPAERREQGRFMLSGKPPRQRAAKRAKRRSKRGVEARPPAHHDAVATPPPCGPEGRFESVATFSARIQQGNNQSAHG
ncbi:MAG TPA: hypothetical protein VIO32_03885 [Candidatus Baltobacteraceae bacterium]